MPADTKGEKGAVRLSAPGAPLSKAEQVAYATDIRVRSPRTTLAQAAEIVHWDGKPASLGRAISRRITDKARGAREADRSAKVPKPDPTPSADAPAVPPVEDERFDSEEESGSLVAPALPPPAPPAPPVPTIDRELLTAFADRLTVVEQAAAAADERLARLEGHPDGAGREIPGLVARVNELGSAQEGILTHVGELGRRPQGISAEEFARYDSKVGQAVKVLVERLDRLQRAQETLRVDCDGRLKALSDRIASLFVLEAQLDGGRRRR